MITTKDMKYLEDLSEIKGISKLQLMENAGCGMFNQMKADFKLLDRKILIVCGHGNNGGDGFVLARYLRKNLFEAYVLFIGEESKLKKESGYNFYLLKDAFPDIFVYEFIDAELYVDAMLGTGAAGRLKEPYSSAVDLMNSSGKPLISVDIPTGMDPDTGEVLDKCIKAEVVYTFHDIKVGLKDLKEKVKIIDIGIKAGL